MEEKNLEEVVEQVEVEQPEIEETFLKEDEESEPTESDAERNLSNLRRLRKEDKEKYERELRETRDRLARYESQQKPASDQDILMKKIEKLERENIEAQLKLKHPDIDDVVSEENIQILIDEHPEVANVLRNTVDLKDKSLAAYKFIKQLGIAKAPVSPDVERAQKNSLKPKPLASIAHGNSPLSHANMFANGLTPELKESLLREMVESAKGA